MSLQQKRAQTGHPPPLTPKSPSTFYFLGTPWLGGRHDGYPLARSFREYIELRGHEVARVPIDIIQAYLSFGVLEAALRKRVPEATLIRRIQEQATLVHENIDDMLDDWRLRFQQESDAGAEEWKKGVGNILSEASSLLTPLFEGLFEFHGANIIDIRMHEIFSRVSLQIVCLLEAIYLSAIPSVDVCNPHIPNPEFPLAPLKFVVPDRHIHDLKQRGWCPFLLQTLSPSPSLMDYITTQSPLIRDSLHKNAGCTPSRCTISDLDERTHHAMHASPNCACDWVKPPLDGVMKALSEGHIPVVQLTEGDLLETKLSSDAPYVAISHVSTDGLGSTTEEELPLCQLKRLAVMVRALVPGGAFWMDSLCVPAVREVRTAAIGLKAQVYRDAAVVLVLDEGIRSIPSSYSCAQKLLQIVGSSWMQHLRTSQEEMIAQ